MTVKWQVTVEDEKQLKEFLKQKGVSRRIIGRTKFHGGSFLVNGQEERVRKELKVGDWVRSEEHTSELQSRGQLVCRLLLEKTKKNPARDGAAEAAEDYGH